MPTARDIVMQVDRLISLPAVYLRVRAVVEDPRSSVHDLAKVVSADPALTVRLLNVVNSVQFGLMRRVASVEHAISILGMQQLYDLVLATSVGTMFQGIRPQHMDVHRFWRQSVLRGLAAQETAHTCRAQSPQRLFLEGLLADIGHLVMYQVVPDMAERAMMRAEMERRPLHEVEREVVGCHYAQVGGALLGEWKLPRVFSDAIAAQIHPDLICSEMAADAAILHFVRVLVDGMLKKQADVEIARQVDPFVWASIDLDATDIGAIRAVAEEHLSEVEAIFFPQLQAAA